MEVLKTGHTYLLDHLDGESKTTLQFVQRRPHHEPKEGTTSQEVVRALINRVQQLDRELPWEGNKQILHHLRMVIILHEMRALQRKVEKDELWPETLPLGSDGHFML